MQLSAKVQQQDSGYLSPLEITFDFEYADLTPSTSEDPCPVIVDSPMTSAAETEEGTDWELLDHVVPGRRWCSASEPICTKSMTTVHEAEDLADGCNATYHCNCSHGWLCCAMGAQWTMDVATSTEGQLMQLFCCGEQRVIAAYQTSTPAGSWKALKHLNSSSYSHDTRVIDDTISDISAKLASIGDDFYKDWSLPFRSDQLNQVIEAFHTTTFISDYCRMVRSFIKWIACKA